MIRIDEIYYNVFLEAMRHHPTISLHWFEPFGSTNLENLLSVSPNFVTKVPETFRPRIVFWDQEPVYQDAAKAFWDQFSHLWPGPKLLITSELDSQAVSWVQSTYSVDTGYYFFHGWAALDWYRGYNHSYLSVPWQDRAFNYRLFCPNNIIGGKRLHRLLLFKEMLDRDILHGNMISFPERCPYHQEDVYTLAENLGFDIPKNILPLIIDDEKNHANDSHRIDFWPQAMQSFCHIVTETVYQSDRIHLTEKTFKPIVLQQPFILVAPRGSLKYLKSYGFKTFQDIWDEDYDDLPDDQRIHRIGEICQEIQSWDPGRLKSAAEHIGSVVKHNHDWFYGGFQDVLWTELRGMVSRW